MNKSNDHSSVSTRKEVEYVYPPLTFLSVVDKHYEEVSHYGNVKVVVRHFIGTQNRLVVLHSALIKAHEETDLSPRSVIYRPVGSTMQLVTKLSSPNFAVLQVHRYLEPSILGVTETLRVKSQHPNSQSPHTSKQCTELCPKSHPTLQ
jgi:hypothetical protein